MIVLDTNVISEPAKPIPNQSVVAWLNAQPAETLYLTATSLAELFAGIEILPVGKRKAQVHQRMSDLVGMFFGPRILSFDRDAAIAYASIMALATQKGASYFIRGRTDRCDRSGPRFYSGHSGYRSLRSGRNSGHRSLEALGENTPKAPPPRPSC